MTLVKQMVAMCQLSCYHCGVVAIEPGDTCYEVWTGRGTVWVSEFCKNDSSFTKDWTPPEEPAPEPLPTPAVVRSLSNPRLPPA